MAPEYMTEPLDETAEGTVDLGAVDRVLELDARRDRRRAGLGRGAGRRARSSRTLLERATMPLVLDADALNAFADDPDRLLRARRARRDHHAASGRDGAAGRHVDRRSAGDRLDIARDFAAAHQRLRRAKGTARSIATPDGKVFINPTGNPGMATGGTGDVLTGMIAAWLAQLLDAEAACKLAVYLHGAGRRSGRGRRRGGRDDGRRPGRASRRRGARADRATAA